MKGGKIREQGIDANFATKLRTLKFSHISKAHNVLVCVANLNHNGNLRCTLYTLCETILVLLRAKQGRLLRAPVLYGSEVV